MCHMYICVCVFICINMHIYVVLMFCLFCSVSILLVEVDCGSVVKHFHSMSESLDWILSTEKKLIILRPFSVCFILALRCSNDVEFWVYGRVWPPSTTNPVILWNWLAHYCLLESVVLVCSSLNLPEKLCYFLPSLFKAGRDKVSSGSGAINCLQYLQIKKRKRRISLCKILCHITSCSWSGHLGAWIKGVI